MQRGSSQQQSTNATGQPLPFADLSNASGTSSGRYPEHASQDFGPTLYLPEPPASQHIDFPYGQQQQHELYDPRMMLPQDVPRVQQQQHQPPFYASSPSGPPWPSPARSDSLFARNSVPQQRFVHDTTPVVPSQGYMQMPPGQAPSTPGRAPAQPPSRQAVPSQQRFVLAPVVPSQGYAQTPPAHIPSSTPARAPVQQPGRQAVPHTGTPTPATQPPAPESTPAPKAKAKAKGSGARSGVNRRDAGTSDTEIAGELTAADLAQAAVTPRAPKEKLVDAPPASSRFTWTDDLAIKALSKIATPEVWRNFLLQQRIVFDSIVVMFSKIHIRVTRDQVCSMWQRYYRKYKLARRLQRGTGGAGDVEAPDPEPNAAENDKDGTSAKKTSRKRKKTDAAEEQYSRETLLAFTKTKIFDIIDVVAHDDPEVVRDIEYSSADSVKARPKDRKRARRDKKKKSSKNKKKSDDSDAGSDSDSDSSDDSDVVASVLSMVKARSKRQAIMDKENLALAEERDVREAEAAKLRREEHEWQREVQERSRKLADTEDKRADERLRLDREKHEREQWAEYERCKASPDALMQRRAELLGQRLLADM